MISRYAGIAPLAIPLILLLCLLAPGCEVSVVEDDPPAPVENGLSLHLPTSNDALLQGDKASFYQALDTTIPGLRTHGWEGGRYGFVRNPARSPAGPIFTRVHQGIDIQPLYRSPAGEPMDTVRAIADGLVAYVNDAPGASSYGRYIVVRHEWEGAPVYSLLAHLDSVAVEAGQRLAAGDPLGRMGYTGAGLARHRAHLHLEIALMLNVHYEAWHEAFYGSENRHGVFFGRNFMGIDPSALYLALAEEPGLTFTTFLRRQPVAYRLAIPGALPLDVLDRYPWLGVDGTSNRDASRAGSWLVSFTREGVPTAIERRPEAVAEPAVVYVAEEVQRRHLSTAGYLARTEGGYVLTRLGRAHAALLATTSGDVPPWF